MSRLKRWCFIGYKHHPFLFLVSSCTILILLIYAYLKVNNITDIESYKPQTKSVTKPYELINSPEFRKKIFERKIERLAEMVKKKPRVIPFETVMAVPNYRVHVFYYAWYGSMKFDKEYSHWSHEYLPNWRSRDGSVKGRHRAPLDIGANFYPALGCYSSRDPVVIETHLRQMKESGIGVAAVSWTPPGMKDSPDKILPTLFHFAAIYDIKITLHVEPYQNRTPKNLRRHLGAFFRQYRTHPALYQVRSTPESNPFPLVYIYDSYLIPFSAWRDFLDVNGRTTVRGTDADAYYIGLLVDVSHMHHIKKSKFDGFYTYFASNGFTYGSSWKNWKNLAKFARDNNLLFIPSVGPGYIDLQVRPWNDANTRHRGHGHYYDVAWRSAISCRTHFVSITSWNEWHEGTQIEPARAYSTPGLKYLDYEPDGPNFYLNLTRFWVEKFAKGAIS